MGFSTSVDVAHETVLIRFHGTVTVQDFSQGRAELADLPGWSPRFTHVFDLTSVNKVDLPTEALRGMATAPPMFDKTAQQVLVALPGTLAFGLARMFQTFGTAQRPNVQIVRTLEEAYEVAERHRPPKTGKR
jgi:hypothetical protein